MGFLNLGMGLNINRPKPKPVEVNDIEIVSNNLQEIIDFASDTAGALDSLIAETQNYFDNTYYLELSEKIRIIFEVVSNIST